MSARICVHRGPAITRVRSSTLMPSKWNPCRLLLSDADGLDHASPRPGNRRGAVDLPALRHLDIQAGRPLGEGLAPWVRGGGKGGGGGVGRVLRPLDRKAEGPGGEGVPGWVGAQAANSATPSAPRS